MYKVCPYSPTLVYCRLDLLEIDTFLITGSPDELSIAIDTDPDYTHCKNSFISGSKIVLFLIPVTTSSSSNFENIDPIV